LIPLNQPAQILGRLVLLLVAENYITREWQWIPIKKTVAAPGNKKYLDIAIGGTPNFALQLNK
jgi:hypothetical protein